MEATSYLNIVKFVVISDPNRVGSMALKGQRHLGAAVRDLPGTKTIQLEKAHVTYRYRNVIPKQLSEGRGGGFGHPKSDTWNISLD